MRLILVSMRLFEKNYLMRVHRRYKVRNGIYGTNQFVNGLERSSQFKKSILEMNR